MVYFHGYFIAGNSNRVEITQINVFASEIRNIEQIGIENTASIRNMMKIKPIYRFTRLKQRGVIPAECPDLHA